MGRGSAILLTRKGHAVSSIVVLVGAVTVMGDEGAGRMTQCEDRILALQHRATTARDTVLRPSMAVSATMLTSGGSLVISSSL